MQELYQIEIQELQDKERILQSELDDAMFPSNPL